VVLERLVDVPTKSGNGGIWVKKDFPLLAKGWFSVVDSYRDLGHGEVSAQAILSRVPLNSPEEIYVHFLNSDLFRRSLKILSQAMFFAVY
jgi:hypothetical protein